MMGAVAGRRNQRWGRDAGRHSLLEVWATGLDGLVMCVVPNACSANKLQ